MAFDEMALFGGGMKIDTVQGDSHREMWPKDIVSDL